MHNIRIGTTRWYDFFVPRYGDRSTWATATQFSNDLSEIEYAVSIAAEIIEEKSKKNMSPWERVLAGLLIQLFATPLHTFGQSFIVSFCEDGDLLSQWRGYGQASGFSLAFSPLSQGDKVRLICKDGFSTMVKRVVYDHDKQRARLRFILRNLIKLVNGFSFTTTSSRLLLPYMILEPSSGKRLPLVEVRCGPSQFQEQSARAMNILLRKYRYKDLPVTLSGVPLRV